MPKEPVPPVIKTVLSSNMLTTPLTVYLILFDVFRANRYSQSCGYVIRRFSEVCLLTARSAAQRVDRFKHENVPKDCGFIGLNVLHAKSRLCNRNANFICVSSFHQPYRSDCCLPNHLSDKKIQRQLALLSKSLQRHTDSCSNPHIL